MNGQRPPEGSRDRAGQNVAVRAVGPPALIVVYQLEQRPRLELHARTFEDEQRLRTWLGRTPLADDAIRQLGWPVATGMAA